MSPQRDVASPEMDRYQVHDGLILDRDWNAPGYCHKVWVMDGGKLRDRGEAHEKETARVCRLLNDAERRERRKRRPVEAAPRDTRRETP